MVDADNLTILSWITSIILSVYKSYPKGEKIGLCIRKMETGFHGTISMACFTNYYQTLVNHVGINNLFTSAKVASTKS